MQCLKGIHDLLAKIGEHIDGTSGAERGCNTDWTLESRICDNIGLVFLGGIDFGTNEIVSSIQGLHSLTNHEQEN